MASAFEILNIEPRFDLDEVALHRRFIELSAATHPDRYTDAIDQADAAERAAHINEAYRTLKDPELRAGALLAALGGPGSDEDRDLPDGFLMEVMEVREEMEEAVAERDREALSRLANWARDQRVHQLGQVAAMFKRVEGLGGPERHDLLRRIRRELNALRYYERMIEQVPGGE